MKPCPFCGSGRFENLHAAEHYCGAVMRIDCGAHGPMVYRLIDAGLLSNEVENTGLDAWDVRALLRKAIPERPGKVDTMTYTYHDLIRDLRAGPVCWPGGYTRRFLTSDGEWATFNGIKADLWQVARATRDGDLRSGYAIIGCDVYWEGPTEQCPFTGDDIESEYGDPAEVSP